MTKCLDELGFGSSSGPEQISWLKVVNHSLKKSSRRHHKLNQLPCN